VLTPWQPSRRPWRPASSAERSVSRALGWTTSWRQPRLTSRPGKGAEMPILRIQHSVPTFDGWKRAFDSDPIDRKGGGVRCYQIHRSVADPNFVLIDLQFDTVDQADEFHQNCATCGPGRPRSSRTIHRPGSSRRSNRRTSETGTSGAHFSWPDYAAAPHRAQRRWGGRLERTRPRSVESPDSRHVRMMRRVNISDFGRSLSSGKGTGLGSDSASRPLRRHLSQRL